MTGVQLHVRVGLNHGAHLGQRGVAGAKGARIVQLGPLHPCGGALIGRGEQPLQAMAQPLQQRRRVGGLAQLVDHLQRPAARALLPQLASAGGVALAAAAHVGLQAVGQARLAQQSRGAQVGQQVVGAALQQRAAQQRQQPPADTGVGERHRAVHRVRDPVGAEHLLHQRRVARRVAEYHGHVTGRRTGAQHGDDLGAAQLQLGALAAGAVQA